jgi:DNA invertase Pin-like site-specific DNA recombinase
VRELITAIMAWVAQMESQRRSERTKAGIARKVQQDPSWRPGRQRGAKDKAKRKRSGYVARGERQRGVRRAS